MSNDPATDDRKAIEYKRLYHFTHADFALEDIKYRKLKIAEFKDMNDPFELGCFKLPTREHRDAMKGIKKEFSEKCGLLCFSEDWENPLLWSHYADKHRGICLGFDVDSGGLCRVSYKEQRPDFPNASTDEFANQLYSAKYKGWEYEREWRGSFNSAMRKRTSLSLFRLRSINGVARSDRRYELQDHRRECPSSSRRLPHSC